MALDSTNTPAASTAAPSAAPAQPVAPVVNAQPAAPDLSALVSPGQNAPNMADAVAGSMAPYQAAENTAIQKAAALANQPNAAPVAGPHQKLIAMVQGLALGLDSFGKAIATHGKEGGVEEVEQVKAQQQQQKIQAQQAAEAQKNTQIQQQLMVADTNHKLGQNVLLMATLPNELKMSDIKVKQGEQGLVTGAADAAKTQAEFMSQYGMSTDSFNSMINGTAGSSNADPKALQNMTEFAQQKIDAAGKILPANDPYLAKAQQVLADKSASPKDIFSAVSSVNRQLGLQQQVSEAKTKKEAADANSPVAKLATPEALAAPGAQAAIQAKIDDPSTDPNDVSRLRALLPKAAVAQLNAETIKTREQRNQQLVSQGDPDQAGKLLANRSLTLAELKSRQVTPQFIASAVLAAQKYDPTFKAAEAEGQARIAAAPANQQFFGNTDSLLIHGGTLDQLAEAAKHISKSDWQILNKTKNWADLQSGNAGISGYGMTAVGAGDDMAKVIGGSTGSDASREMVLRALDPSLSPAQRDAAIAAARNTVTSQRNGRIGTNPYLKDMYPDPSTMQESSGVAGTSPAGAKGFTRPSNVSAGAILMAAPGDPTPRWIEPQNVKAAHNFGAVEVK